MINKIDGTKFGKRLEESMKKANITNAEMTKALNLNKNAIGNYKNGQIPNASILVDISNFLGISIDYLLLGKSENTLTLEEKQLINNFRRSNDTNKQTILTVAKLGAEANENNQELKYTDTKIG